MIFTDLISRFEEVTAETSSEGRAFSVYFRQFLIFCAFTPAIEEYLTSAFRSGVRYISGSS